MAIVSKLPTKREAIPHEPEYWMEFRPLSGRQLREASEVRTERVLRNVRAMGGEVYQALQNVDTDGVQQAAADPLNAYDRETLCRYGIVAWSYDERLRPQAIAELDDATEEWAARIIVELSKPYSEAERGNA